MRTVLVVDDKEMMRDSVAMTLKRAGFQVVSASDGAGALSMVASRRPDVVVSDLKMPGMSGLELVERVRGIDDELPIVLMTAFGTVETAVQAMKLGAYDYVTKPFEGDELVVAVKRAIEHARLKRENAVLKLGAAPTGGGGSTPQPARRGLDRIIGESPAMLEVKARLAAIAASHGTVLITGESGTGKEIVARAMHEMSPRAEEPFLGVNCAAMSESLLESELFGHEKGAFTGADRLRKGRFELAHGGTLLLDEISEVRPQIQAKLLRVLQERSFERVGSSLSIGVDVRVFATTNRDLGEEVAKGSFRSDLFYRLNVLPVHLPPLRERMADVAMLAPHFVRVIAEREGRPGLELSDGALNLLMSYSWPGNVRELQNLCERAVVLATGTTIDADLIRGWMAQGAEDNGRLIRSVPMEARLPEIVSRDVHVAAGNGNGVHGKPMFVMGDEPRPLEDIERDVIVQTLRRFNGHRAKTATALGIGVRTLGLKLKKWKEMRLVAESL